MGVTVGRTAQCTLISNADRPLLFEYVDVVSISLMRCSVGRVWVAALVMMPSWGQQMLSQRDGGKQRPEVAVAERLEALIGRGRRILFSPRFRVVRCNQPARAQPLIN